MLESLEFPQPGDSIFSESTDWELNACVIHRCGDPAPDKTGYVRGYRLAPNELFKYVRETQRHQDELLFPILFLWQHYIEITLKEILSMLCHVVEKPVPTMNTHSVSDLWTKTIHLLPNVYPQVAQDTNTLEAAGDIIDEVSKILISDGQEGFRYPNTLSSESTIISDFRHINLGVLDTVMTKLGDFLGCILQDIQVKVKSKDEFDAQNQR